MNIKILSDYRGYAINLKKIDNFDKHVFVADRILLRGGGPATILDVDFDDLLSIIDFHTSKDKVFSKKAFMESVKKLKADPSLLKMLLDVSGPILLRFEGMTMREISDKGFANEADLNPDWFVEVSDVK